MFEVVARFIIDPIIFVLGRLIGGIYKLFFGWWLDPRTNRGLDDRLAQEVREKLSFLFTEHGASVVPTENKYPRGMDFSYITVEAGNLRLLFLRGRGDLTVRVAPKCAPKEFHELALVAMVIKTPQGIGRRTTLHGLDDVDKLLRAEWGSLNQALSPAGYPATRQRLGSIYDLSGDELWYAGIRIPEHLRTQFPDKSGARRRL
ncbi:MAG TPA: hypothetical protein VG759_24855 [Candidatus Angelobacter sp.]|jgi:hypothetical protein|nr:hypothetical protein [Candidatus Angelobacter sp.]